MTTTRQAEAFGELTRFLAERLDGDDLDEVAELISEYGLAVGGAVAKSLRPGMPTVSKAVASGWIGIA
jgi:hypothetical protein